MLQAFPTGFTWGVATSAYQIEGAVDSRGSSIWDEFVRRPGAIKGGDTGDIACDHARRWREDISLMKQIGVNGYRFSVSWPRVMPDGRRLSEPGLAFYDALVDALLEAGIRPNVTLFHWDYPLELYKRGGWLNGDSPRWFADYVAAVVRVLGDRVTDWVTLNEPQVFVGLGHHQGEHAPGLKLPFNEVLQAGHHALLAHGRAVMAIRAGSPGPCRIGYTPVARPQCPMSSAPADVAAARRETFAVRGEHVWNNAWWMDPVYLGAYPEDGLRQYGRAVPSIGPDDFAVISQELDYFGANIYIGDRVTQAGEHVALRPGAPTTAMNWPVSPSSLEWGPKFFFERYGKPICILENGVSCRDWIERDGVVRDYQRIDFTARYLLALLRAIESGVPVLGYYHWSLLDNFEWAEGYRERFGLVHVDYDTQERTLKESARWYRDVIASNGRSLEAPLGHIGT